MSKKKRKTRSYQKYSVINQADKKKLVRKKLENDYLKYYRVVMHWAMAKYDLDRMYIEMMFYLYSKRLFTEKDIDWYNNAAANWSSKRKTRLKDGGWITVWEKPAPGKPSLFELSLKGRRFVESFYRKLNGEEAIPTTHVNNPMFLKNNRFVDKVMIPKVREFNNEYKERLKKAQKKQEEGE